MCSNPQSAPPVEPAAIAATGRSIILEARDGTRVSAFQADADAPSGAAIIVLPDYYGLTPFYERLALRFAEAGVDAIALDYYARTAEPPPRPSSFDHRSHADRTSWAGLEADAAAAASELRKLPHVRSLFSIGFCFGGRLSFLLATQPQLALSGVVGFYGWPVGSYGNGMPAPASVAADLRAPLLAIFGGADDKIPAADVATFEAALAAADADNRLITYEGAPHSFFDRQHEGHVEAAASAWAEVLGFVGASGATPRD